MKQFFSILFVTIFSFSCNKSTDFKAETDLSNETISLKEKDQVPQLIEAKRYTEFACVVNNCAGTACEGSKGSCKSMACTPIPGGCPGKLTSNQIETFAINHANRMVNEGYISKENFTKSKELAKQILKNAQ